MAKVHAMKSHIMVVKTDRISRPLDRKVRVRVRVGVRVS
jgi:hypothetical protein